MKIAAALTVVAMAGTARAGTRHTVSSGESLWIIAQRYGCPLDDLRRANRLDGNDIFPGDRLELPASCTKPPLPKILKRDKDAEPKPETAPRDPSLNAVETEKRPSRPAIQSALVRYRVARGDTLIALARRYGTSVLAIQTQNDLADNLIMIGQVIDIPAHSRSTIEASLFRPVRVILGQSIGPPQHGRLVHATTLPPMPVYYIRRPKRAYGTLHMVEQIERVARVVKARHPKVHKLAIGDLSARHGGRITHHVSHQSGRDVDLGFYFKRKPKGYPKTFITATASTLDFAATWTLLKTLADTADEDGGVYMMFLDYNVQKMIYDWARQRGVARSVLRWMFQYPRGRGVREGLIRHEPGHAAHVHVRFKCPPKDRGCD